MEQNWFKIDEQAERDIGRIYAKLERSEVSQDPHTQRLRRLEKDILDRFF